MEYNSLLQVTNSFAEQTTCINYLTGIRWPEGKVICPICSHDKVYTLKGEFKRFKCAKCRSHFSALKKTIFENSPIPLQKWFIAIYLHTSHKKGISSIQLGKDIDVSQKTAWFMLQRIRHSMETGTFEMIGTGIFEADETYIGGKESNKHQSRGVKAAKAEAVRQGANPNAKLGRSLVDKIPVAGIIQRNGNVSAKVVKHTSSDELIGHIQDNIKLGSTIVTDEYPSYHKLSTQYAHQVIRHRLGQYVSGEFHTNSIEGFWAQLKRGIYGIYHHVSPAHLDKYVDEFEFRYNSKKKTEQERFDLMINRSEGYLSYSQLITKQ